MQTFYPNVHFVIYFTVEFQLLKQLSDTDISFTNDFTDPNFVLQILIEVF